MVSFVWDYFEKQDLVNARCKTCRNLIKYGKGTLPLIEHLKLHNIHRPDLKRPAPDPAQKESAKKQRTFDELMNKNSLERQIAIMTSKNNLSFNQVATTTFIRSQLAKEFPGKIIPQDGKGMARLTLKY